MISSYEEDSIDVLRALALFQKMDLPYFPLELLALWYTSSYSTILDKISDLVNISVENNGVYLRNNILTSHIIRSISSSKKSFLLKDILALVSPQISDTVHSYWNEIQSTLMDKIREAQKTDMEVASIKEKMSEGKSKGFREDEYDTLRFEDRVYVPNDPEIRKLILQEAHDSPYSIHLGNTKIYLDLKETFW